MTSRKLKFERLLKKPIFRSVVWNVAGGVIHKCSLFIAITLAGRLLGQKSFGELGYVRSTINSFTSLAGFGTGSALTKFISEFQEKDAKSTASFLLFGLSFVSILALSIAIAIFFCASLIAGQVGKIELTSKLQIGCLLVIGISLTSALFGALAGFKEFLKTAIAQMVTGVIALPLILTATYYYQVEGAIVGLFLAAMIQNALMAWGLYSICRQRQLKFSFREMPKTARTMLCFSLPLVLSGLMIGPMNWLADSIFAKSEEGLAELGVYFAALQINLMIQTINLTLGQVLFPYCVENIAKGSKAFEAVNILLPWAIGLAVTLPVLIFPELLNLIWGDKFARDSLRIVGVFECVTAIIIASKQGIARDVIAKHRVWLSFLSSLVWGVTLIVFAFLLQDLGAIGRSSAAVSAYLVNTVIFIPIFIMQGVCNRRLVVCLPAMAIWSLLGLIVFLQLQFNISVPVRLLILLASASFIGLALKTIYKKFTLEKSAFIPN